MKDDYLEQVIKPGDRASKLACDINYASYHNCPAVSVVPHEPGNFRGPVGFVWRREILEKMADYSLAADGTVQSWTMLQAVQDDGAGGKPQFLTLLNEDFAFHGHGWEVITMPTDDLARSGRKPCVMSNQVDFQRVTERNFHSVATLMRGYGAALAKSGLVNITGETAVMRHSITAFCDEQSDDQLIFTWGGTCIGLTHRDKLINPASIEPGMVIVGLYEQGYRCNGGGRLTDLLLDVYGSVRAIRADNYAMSFVRRLTKHSISYAKTITRVVGWHDDGSVGEPLAHIAGIAHITGGGVWGKFGEMLPEGVGALLDTMPLPAPVLIEAQDLSLKTDRPISDHEAYGTFHGGCGMLVVCRTRHDADVVINEALADQIPAQLVGVTTYSPDREVRIKSRFKTGEWLTPPDPQL